MASHRAKSTPKIAESPSSEGPQGGFIPPDPSPGTDRDPRPLAAYGLGYHSVEIWSVHEIFCLGFAEDECEPAAWEYVPKTVEELRSTQRVLAGEMRSDVFKDLSEVFDRLLTLNIEIIQAWKSGRRTGYPIGTTSAPGKEHWLELRLLADRALDEGHILKPFYWLGVASGEYDRKLWEEVAPKGEGPPLYKDQNADPFDESFFWASFPDIRDFLGRAKAIPVVALQKIPLLRSLVQLASRFDQIGQAAFLREFFEQNRVAWSRDWSKIPSKLRLFADLVSTIHKGLKKLTTLEVKSFQTASNTEVDPIKPRWDMVRILWYGDKRARSVATQAVLVRKILDRFQELDWPRWIANPLADKHAHSKDITTLNDTLKSLNHNLRYIRFRADGTGSGIFWEKNSPKNSPKNSLSVPSRECAG
jgi:hypothetical protein